jgi:hypothetical protein
LTAISSVLYLAKAKQFGFFDSFIFRNVKVYSSCFYKYDIPDHASIALAFVSFYLNGASDRTI